MKQPVWPRLGLALLMGALVGPYVWNRLGQSLSLSCMALIVTGPFIAAALLNEVIRRDAVALSLALALPLLLIVWVALISLYPAAWRALWQGYANDAAFISLLIVMLITPAAAAFAAGAMPPRPDAQPAFDTRAVLYALVAWLGIGVQNLALTYLVPVAESIWYIAVHHSAGPHGGPVASTLSSSSP